MLDMQGVSKYNSMFTQARNDKGRGPSGKVLQNEQVRRGNRESLATLTGLEKNRRI